MRLTPTMPAPSASPIHLARRRHLPRYDRHMVEACRPGRPGPPTGPERRYRAGDAGTARRAQPRHGPKKWQGPLVRARTAATHRGHRRKPAVAPPADRRINASRSWAPRPTAGPFQTLPRHRSRPTTRTQRSTPSRSQAKKTSRHFSGNAFRNWNAETEWWREAVGLTRLTYTNGQSRNARYPIDRAMLNAASSWRVLARCSTQPSAASCLRKRRRVRGRSRAGYARSWPCGNRARWPWDCHASKR